MRTVSPPGHRQVPDTETAEAYLEATLDGQWHLDSEYLGNEADLGRAWTLQNEVRRRFDLPLLTPTDLRQATEGLLP